MGNQVAETNWIRKSKLLLPPSAVADPVPF